MNPESNYKKTFLGQVKKIKHELGIRCIIIQFPESGYGIVVIRFWKFLNQRILFLKKKNTVFFLYEEIRSFALQKCPSVILTYSFIPLIFCELIDYCT